MYQDIINFLLSRKKKMLTKEEAEKFIMLLAESIGIESEYKDKTDDQVLIKNILEDYNFNETEEDSAVANVLDEIFELEDISYDNMSELDESEECEDSRPLIKRKITRGAFKGTTKKLKGQSSEITSNALPNKKEQENADVVSKNDTDLDLNTNEIKTDDDELIATLMNNETIDQIGTIEDCLRTIDDDLKEINEMPKFDSSVFGELKSSDTKFDSNLFMKLSGENDAGNISELRYKNSMESRNNENLNVSGSSRANNPQSNNTDNPRDKPEEDEFKFDIGELEEVHNTGPEFKFYDDNNKEI